MRGRANWFWIYIFIVVLVVAVVPMLITDWSLIVSRLWPRSSPKVVEAFPLKEVLAYSEYRISDLRKFLRNLSCWRANGTFIFIPFWGAFTSL